LAVGAVVFAIVAVAAVLVGSTAARSAKQPYTHNFTLVSGGHVRSYIVYAPPAGRGRPRPLVLLYGGAGDTAIGATQDSDLEAVAAQQGIIAVFLQGYEDTWNEGAGHTPAEVAGINDVAFTAAVLNKVEARYSVNRREIAATGLSNGALLTELLGCRLATRFTLIMPVEGELPASVSPGCAPQRPIAVYEIHGTADATIPYGGGPFVGIGGGTTVLSAPASAARWAALDGCAASSTLSAEGTTVLTSYAGCRDRVGVVLDSITGGMHAFPPNFGTIVARTLRADRATRPAATG
jgi:polyhydroxybutyrate depolymerase